MFYTFSKTTLETSVKKYLQISLKTCLLDLESCGEMKESVFHYIVIKASLLLSFVTYFGNKRWMKIRQGK